MLRLARLPSGVTLAWQRAGHGRRVLLIHGVMGDWSSWDAQWPAFTAQFDCVRYSRRYNHPNRNEHIESTDHSPLVEAQDLDGLLDHLGWNSAALVGSSLGAYVALLYALAHPKRCTALALVEPPIMGYAAFSEEGRRAEEDFRTRVREPARAAFLRGEDALAARIMTGGIQGIDAARLSDTTMQRRLANVQAMRRLALSRNEFPMVAPERLAALAVPTLLMAGTKTAPIHAAIFRNLCARMPQARSVWVPDAGHSVARDNPIVYNRLVIEFLCSHGAHPHPAPGL